MKRLRLARCSGQLLQARRGAAMAANRRPFLDAARCRYSSSYAQLEGDAAIPVAGTPPRFPPSPPHERAAESPKLVALHARLKLSKQIPYETLARALIAPSADPNPNFNNSTLAFLGSSIMNYHVLEYIMCRWPRLPMGILYETLRAYAGHEALMNVAQQWGVEVAAAPGHEVDPGLLQWSSEGPSSTINTRWGLVREEVKRSEPYRRGMSSRVVYDDDFGDVMRQPGAELETHAQRHTEAVTSFVHAVVGAIYAFSGQEKAKEFVTLHILHRQFDPSILFEFKLPTRELSLLCAREGFEPPLARLESETGRRTRHPVYIVGIYSGKDKLGEGDGSSLDMARRKASMMALKAWYLYSPGKKVPVPSDTLSQEKSAWKPAYIDIGEII